MRHRINHRKFGRTTNQRKALLSGLAYSLIKHGRITTTLPKAKDLRPFVEKLVTVAKKGTLAARRYLLAILHQQDVVQVLMAEVADQARARPGGYTRIIKNGYRYGDAAPVAIIEFVDKRKGAAAPTAT